MRPVLNLSIGIDGERIAQLVFCSAYRRSELVKDEERTAGHGSTGQ